MSSRGTGEGNVEETSSRPSLSRRRSTWWGAALMAVMLLGWSLLPWEWSTIDDPGFVLGMQALREQHGAGAPFAMFWNQLQGDLAWGLFRPSYWAYPALVYVLPIGLAHVLRLAMVIVAIGGPLIALHRRGVRGTPLVFSAALLIAAGHALYTGLVFVSFQELSGVAFVGLGLALPSARWRTANWLVAAWFKSPFAWLLLGDAVLLWRSGRRRHAMVSLGLGVLTLGAAFWFSRGGAYTAAASLDYGALWRVQQNLPKLLEPQSATILVALVWWLLWTGSRLKLRSAAIVIGIGWAGYVVLMLPWGVTSYYLGPMDYLLGVFFVFALGHPRRGVPRWHLVAGLSVPIILAGLLLVTNAGEALRWNATLKAITTCITTQPAPRVLVSPDIGIEAPDRMEQNAMIASPGWSGTVELAEGSGQDSVGQADFYVAFDDDPGVPDIAPVCVAPAARIYGLSP